MMSSISIVAIDILVYMYYIELIEISYVSIFFIFPLILKR